MTLAVKFSESIQSFATQFGEINNVSDGGYDRGYAEGNRDGYDAGYSKGNADGIEQGYVGGYEEGYEAASKIIDVSRVADNTLKEAYAPTAGMVRDYAFYNLSNLEKAHFPVATSVGVNSFISCKKLKNIHFPAVATIGSNAFMSCEVLPAADFPMATKIDSAAFAYCYILEKLDAGSLASIASRAFWGCSRLTTVVLRGQTICDIATDAFGGTPIAAGNGYIYVQDNLVDGYKAVSSYASQIKPISELKEEAHGATD